MKQKEGEEAGGTSVGAAEERTRDLNSRNQHERQQSILAVWILQAPHARGSSRRGLSNNPVNVGVVPQDESTPTAQPAIAKIKEILDSARPLQVALIGLHLEVETTLPRIPPPPAGSARPQRLPATPSSGETASGNNALVPGPSMTRGGRVDKFPARYGALYTCLPGWKSSRGVAIRRRTTRNARVRVAATRSLAATPDTVTHPHRHR